MAANQAAFNNYLRDVLLIESPDVRNAINGQGITAFEDLTHRTDKYVQELFTKIRSPGGMIINPAFPAAAGAPPVVEFIPNRGVSVGVNLEFRVRQLRYYLFHLFRLQRDFVPGQATLARLERAWALKERIERMKEADRVVKLDVLLKVENIRKTIEDIDELLGQRMGAYGAPLSYLVRDNANVDEAIDPGYGIPDALSELVRRTRHDGDQFEEDNMALWLLVREVTHGGPAWNWTKPFSTTKDGRGSYFALRDHYMGKSFQKRNVAQSERVLSTVFYDGKSRNFTFEMFCEKLNLAFQDLEEAGEMVTEDRKVRILLENIRAPELLMSVERVQGSELETSFQASMNYLAEQVDKKRQLQAKIRGTNRNISAMGRGGGSGRGGRDGRGRGGKGVGGRGKGGRGLTRYYKYKEWAALSKEKQEEIRQERQKAQASGDKRNVSALEATDFDSKKKLRIEEPAESMGDQMSRRS